MPPDFLSLARERVVVLDGAMGTSIHRYDPTDADWGGKELMNVCDAVALTHPEWIRAIHTGFLEVGCDAVETNTFNGSRHVLAEFGLGDQCLELNKLNARLAREAVGRFNTPAHPRFVIGSVGPGTKQPSIQNPGIAISFDDCYASYRPQMRGLLEGVAVIERDCDAGVLDRRLFRAGDRKSTRLNSSHTVISYAVFC